MFRDMLRLFSLDDGVSQKVCHSVSLVLSLPTPSSALENGLVHDSISWKVLVKST